MRYDFYAYMDRMKYIKRWQLMRCMRDENIMEHSQEVALIAHALVTIHNDIYGGKADVLKTVLYAIYHETAEVMTGDLPTPIKYYNPDIKLAYKQVERIAGERLLELLPQQLKDCYAPLIFEEDGAVTPIVKAADKLSAYIKCIEEQKAGNTEFDSAADATLMALRKMDLPELSWFIENCLDPFRKNLDQL